MQIFNQMRIYLKSVAQLGLKTTGLFFLYRLMLVLRVFCWLTPARAARKKRKAIPLELRRDILRLPSTKELADIVGEQAALLLAEADDLAEGTIRLFGGSPVDLDLSPPSPLRHWSYYDRLPGQIDGRDIKFIWEPARFDWAYKLARAYRLTQDERYAEAFWQHTLLFLEANPTNLGPNWASAQEIALRLIAMVFAYQIFASSPTSDPQRVDALSSAILAHAERIPPTLIYSRAQKNNHLLVEAAGMITAAHALPDHPRSNKLLNLGRYYFHKAIQEQITPEGVYIQQSTNYHRLMLQIALWVFALGEQFPALSMKRLAAATRWLYALVDKNTGKVPNLGHNDGANIQPLAICPYHDYRPVLATAGRAFLNTQLLPAGPWDENALWLGIIKPQHNNSSDRPSTAESSLVASDRFPEPLIISHLDCDSHAYFRTARYAYRPAHADQLHVDLWWNGSNLAQDAGTYLYNGSAPWGNPFAGTDVHNTISVGRCDQMLKAGKFLWLDWAQAEIIECSLADDRRSATAIHDGYLRFGLIHQRRITALPGRIWEIEDKLRGKVKPEWRVGKLWRGDHNNPFEFRLHWLLPDWPFELTTNPEASACTLRVRSPYGWIQLRVDVSLSEEGQVVFHIVRAGESTSAGYDALETWGWVSPTYGLKIPALSFSITTVTTPPVTFLSSWFLPEDRREQPVEPT